MLARGGTDLRRELGNNLQIGLATGLIGGALLGFLGAAASLALNPSLLGSAGNVIRRSTFIDSDAQWHSGWTNENLVSIFSALSSPVHKVETRQRNLCREATARDAGFHKFFTAPW